MQKSTDKKYGAHLKNINKIWVCLSILAILNLYSLTNAKYPLSEVFYDNNLKFLGEVNYYLRDMNNDGKLDKIYEVASIIKSDSQTNLAKPKSCDKLIAYSLSNNYFFVIDFGHAIFSCLTDKKLRFISMITNKHDVQQWAMGMWQSDDPNEWTSKYTIGFRFVELKIKANKIDILTHDGGGGATGGFYIQHLIEIKNNKPVTLVSQFIENKSKDKAVKDFQKEEN